MRRILHELEDAIRQDQAVAYTVLVETQGSTPQKPGAAMLVFPDGSQAGTLGGGCVEAQVKHRALQLLDKGKTELLTFQLDSDPDWEDGLICGGRMKMLVDPVRPGQDVSYFQKFHSLLTSGAGCTETVVLDPDRAGGGHTGDRFLFDAKSELVASRNRAELPASLRGNLPSLPSRPRPYVADGVAYLTQLEGCRLVIVGGGHVGQKVAELAAAVDFDVWVVDDREPYCNSERFPLAKRLIVDEIDGALKGLDVDSNTFCVIVTRGHKHDEQALRHLAQTPACYVGMIGSKRKIKLIFEDLLKEGVPRDALARVKAPIGFDIGSQTVAEIGISIVAELVAHRNLGESPSDAIRPNLLAGV